MAKAVTYLAPVNIATIKYWGKRDESLVLPLNDSVSVTISVDVMHAKTTISISSDYEENQIWLNGKKENFQDNKRLTTCITEIKNRARQQHPEFSEDFLQWNIYIRSENNFPTAAGLASSAAGYACLVAALARLYDVKGDLSELARRGSGSACRSLHGGFVRWHKGIVCSGADSIATRIAPASHWPELRILILVVKTEAKSTSSTKGMQISVSNSKLLHYRAQNVVPERVEAMVKAILQKNFPVFAEITMLESNQFHAVCLDTYPPLVYMNDTSHNIAAFVHAFNRATGQAKLAYTFDAGANACLFFLEEDTSLVVSTVEHYFPEDPAKPREFRGDQVPRRDVPENIMTSIGVPPYAPGSVKGLILAKVGDGPVEVCEENSL